MDERPAAQRDVTGAAGGGGDGAATRGVSLFSLSWPVFLCASTARVMTWAEQMRVTGLRDAGTVRAFAGCQDGRTV